MRPRCISLLVTLMLAGTCAPARPCGAAGTESGTHYLYLIRHGTYDADHHVHSPAGAGLNALGHEQSRQAGRRLAALPVHFASLVSSPLQRALDTAEDIGKALRMRPAVDSLLRECTPTSDRADYMRNHTPSDIADCDSSLARAWGRYMVATPGADRSDILVCHANVIRWFVSRVVALDPVHWSTMEIANGSLTILAVRPDGSVKLVLFSDVGHLPLGTQTWTGAGAGWGRSPEP